MWKIDIKKWKPGSDRRGIHRTRQENLSSAQISDITRYLVTDPNIISYLVSRQGEN